LQIIAKKIILKTRAERTAIIDGIIRESAVLFIVERHGITPVFDHREILTNVHNTYFYKGAIVFFPETQDYFTVYSHDQGIVDSVCRELEAFAKAA
jgi:hypothetical protein